MAASDGAKRYQVVIADDNEYIRLCLTEILEEEFEVVAAVADGFQLIDAVAALRPDVLVVDVVMPLLNGLEALQSLNDAGIQFTAVMVSANTEEAYIMRALELGAMGYVAKATATDDLPRAMRAALRGERFISGGEVQPDGEDRL